MPFKSMLSQLGTGNLAPSARPEFTWRSFMSRLAVQEAVAAARGDCISGQKQQQDVFEYDSPADTCDSFDDNSLSQAAAADTAGQKVRKRIRQMYKSFRRRGNEQPEEKRNATQLSAEAEAAVAVAAAAAAAAAPDRTTVSQQRTDASRSRLVAGGAELLSFTNHSGANASTCVSMNNSEKQQRQQLHLLQTNVNNEGVSELEVVQSVLSQPGGGDQTRDDDLYSVLTVDAEELRNFYSDVYVVAECEGVRLKTKRTNRLEDIQMSFMFYRRRSTTEPIEFKMYANHQGLGRRVLIGQLSLTLQPGEPFDGMSVRRSIRERPGLRRDGGSGLLFNFLSGLLHTQHLSGV